MVPALLAIALQATEGLSTPDRTKAKDALECESLNNPIVKTPDGRTLYRQMLSDGARFAWRDGQCGTVGGLPPYVPPPLKTLESTKTATVLPTDTSYSIHPVLFPRTWTTVAIKQVAYISPALLKRVDFWVAERIDHTSIAPPKSAWADSRTCPHLRPTLAALRSLEPIKIAPPGVPPPPADIVMDGTNYEINAPGVFPAEKSRGQITVSGNGDSPIAKWVIDAEAALKPCWRDNLPKLGD